MGFFGSFDLMDKIRLHNLHMNVTTEKIRRAAAFYSALIATKPRQMLWMYVRNQERVKNIVLPTFFIFKPNLPFQHVFHNVLGK